MAALYTQNGTKIMVNDEVRATCSDVASAEEAVELLNKAHYKNSIKRQYTAAARLIAEAETLPGFAWTGETLKLGL